MSTTVLQSGDSVTIGVHTLPVWPKGQKVQNWRDTGILVTQFADHDFYAPALAPLHGRIMACVSYLEGRERLIEDGRAHICTATDGCGFAREQDVRSPMDWRAMLTQERPGAASVLETYGA